MLDYSPLTAVHLGLALGSFVAAFLLLKILLNSPRELLRRTKGSRARYAGVVLIATLTSFGLFAIDSTVLRLGLLGAAALTLIVGTLDEIIDLSPLVQVLCQLAIAAATAFSGWTILAVTDPFSSSTVIVTFFPTALTILWLLLLMNALNWLDGADGLAPGVATVGLLTLAAVSLLPSTQDQDTLSLALVGAGATLGFLLWNWPPARAYLGTSGSWFLGLYLGLVAIRSGGKIATTLLVLALPVIDASLVIISRLGSGRRPWQKDRQYHLHHRLLALGVKPASLALLIIILSAGLGYSAVALQTKHKLLALIVVAVVLLITTASLWRRQRETFSSH